MNSLLNVVKQQKRLPIQIVTLSLFSAIGELSLCRILYASDSQEGAQQNFGVQFVRDNRPFAMFLGVRLDYQTREGNEKFLWDMQIGIRHDLEPDPERSFAALGVQRVALLMSVRPEIGKFVRNRGARKILPQAYG